MNTPHNPSTQPQDQPDYQQPVAYDAEGRPLYAHPPVQTPTPSQMPTPEPVVPEVPQPVAPQLVQMVRPLDPPKQEMTAEVKKRHDESLKKYPYLNLSDGEFVIRDMRRHPIGLFLPMLIGTVLLVITLSFMFLYDSLVDTAALSGPAADPAAIIFPGILFCALVAMGMYIAYYVYTHNKFFLTNESVIQEIQTNLFSRHEQTVSLGSIEDASYRQKGVIQYLFHYGSIRLSTEGDETTYRFTYVTNPKEHIAVLNNAVEAFKLGRPVHPHDN